MAAQNIDHLGCGESRQILGADHRSAVFWHDVVETSAVLGEMFNAGLVFQCPAHVRNPSRMCVTFLLRVSQHFFHEGEHRVLIKPTGAQMSIFPTTHLELSTRLSRRVYAVCSESIHIFLAPSLINDVEVFVPLINPFFNERKQDFIRLGVTMEECACVTRRFEWPIRLVEYSAPLLVSYGFSF